MSAVLTLSVFCSLRADGNESPLGLAGRPAHPQRCLVGKQPVAIMPNNSVYRVGDLWYDKGDPANQLRNLAHRKSIREIVTNPCTGAASCSATYLASAAPRALRVLKSSLSNAEQLVAVLDECRLRQWFGQRVRWVVFGPNELGLDDIDTNDQPCENRTQMNCTYSKMKINLCMYSYD